ncbi:PEP-CTERM sorting domain-containing protein [Rugamonas rivuli]|uniref:PEP-CTERM sorting domain-containing protein n=1 Tax=Rugamonas rivuli TaxID=2743358 RepID=A0A843SQH3_9BURK|nr:PEP-CTERM sorting domain-containing protein [Rugamonas rivuli]MQA22496.1 PEP-CTERM sorting domain-containing protein [Rugamonas rivuli]
MHPLSRLTKPLLASALLLCCFSASANSASASGTAAFSHLQLGVIDLTPSDSQAAGYTLTSTDTWLVGATVSAGADGVLDAITVRGGQASSEPPGQKYTYGSIFYHVTVSAHSALTLSGHVLTSDSRYGDPDPDRIYGTVSSYVYISPAGGPPYPHYLFQQYSSAWGGNTVASKERDFMVAYANTGDSAQDLVVRVFGDTSYEHAQQVPEPHTYALLLAGLMAVPLVRRRQARRQAQDRNAA